MAVDTEWAHKLSEVLPHLTRTEREFSDFVNSYPHETAFMSLREVAEKSGVSRPKIIEFFRKLGFNSFQEFRTSIQNFYKQHIDSYRASTITFKKIKTISELIESAVEIETKSLLRMKENISEEDLSKIADSILHAGKVFIFGLGTGFYPAHYLSQRLRRYKIDIHLIASDLQHIAEEMYPLSENDLLIVFKYSAQENIFSSVMSWAKDTGCKIVMITEQVFPHLVNLADHVVYIDRGDLEFKNSMALPMTFTNLILLAVELKGKDTVERYLKDLEKRRETYDLSFY